MLLTNILIIVIILLEFSHKIKHGGVTMSNQAFLEKQEAPFFDGSIGKPWGKDKLFTICRIQLNQIDGIIVESSDPAKILEMAEEVSLLQRKSFLSDNKDPLEDNNSSLEDEEYAEKYTEWLEQQAEWQETMEMISEWEGDQDLFRLIQYDEYEDKYRLFCAQEPIRGNEYYGDAAQYRSRGKRGRKRAILHSRKKSARKALSLMTKD